MGLRGLLNTDPFLGTIWEQISYKGVGRTHTCQGCLKGEEFASHRSFQNSESAGVGIFFVVSSSESPGFKKRVLGAFCPCSIIS